MEYQQIVAATERQFTDEERDIEARQAEVDTAQALLNTLDILTRSPTRDNIEVGTRREENPRSVSAWLKAMKQNAVAFRGNVAALKAVNSGEIEGAVIYHYYYFGDQARTGEHPNNTALHYFRNRDPGAFVSVSGGGVLASSKHAAQAQAFLKWVTGKGGQGILRTGDSYEYAVGVGAESNPKLVPLAELEAPTVDPSKLNGKKVIDLMMQAGLL